jgi:tetratricopeptide (TPR) repeat protein
LHWLLCVLQWLLLLHTPARGLARERRSQASTCVAGAANRAGRLDLRIDFFLPRCFSLAVRFKRLFFLDGPQSPSRALGRLPHLFDCAAPQPVRTGSLAARHPHCSTPASAMQAPPGTELVPNVGGDDLPSVPIDELDFDFVAKCTDTQKLRAILAILESGKEGHYPELIQATINRLLDQLPPKEKKLFVALRSKPSASDEVLAKDDISAWIDEIGKKDAAVAQAARAAATAAAAGFGGSSTVTGAPVRGAAAAAAPASKEIFGDEPAAPAADAGGGGDDANELAKMYASRVPVRGRASDKAAVPERQQLGSSTASIHGDSNSNKPKWTAEKPDPKVREFKSYYEDWDRFDPEQELDKLTAEEKAEEEARRAKQRAQDERLAAAAAARQERMRELGIGLDPGQMTAEERAFTADYEKRKGNECFKANEFEDAVVYFSRSIFVQPENAKVWANRAMAHLRLKQYEQAEDDCTEAIRLEPNYVKAFSRRAMTCV